MNIAPIFPANLQKLWNLLELRVLVLLSLLLQAILIASGNRRKYTTNKWVAAVIWLSYLSADAVATLALGVLTQSEGDSKHVVDPFLSDATALWAPFLLMHLGGPDSITAYALADNELWSRHLLGLFGQVFVAIYIFLRSFTGSDLNWLWMVIFLAGVVKYLERSWVLFSASKDRFRDSMISGPDPGPNYAKFMDEMVSKEREGYKVFIQSIQPTEPRAIHPPLTGVEEILDATALHQAHFFYGTFKKLFADLILSFQDRKTTKDFFEKVEWDKAFKIVEIELGLVFDLFYTKSFLVFSKTGFFLRIFSCLSTIAAFVAFLIIKKKGDHGDELIITYLLLAGAIFLEMYAILMLVSSDRMMIWLVGDWTTRPRVMWMLKNPLLWAVPKLASLLHYLHIVPARRWSNSVGQYNVLKHCLDYTPKRAKFRWYLDKFDQYREKYLFWRIETVGDDLKKRIFRELQTRSKGNTKKLDSNWFDKILFNELNCFDETDEVEFDQSVLLWHIATDICQHNDAAKLKGATDICQHNDAAKLKSDVELKSKNCILLSNYMVHLLIASPFMLPSGIGQIRLQDTCAEASKLFNEPEIDERRAFSLLSRVDTRYMPSKVKGDRSKSVLFEARRLAHRLYKPLADGPESLNDINQRWEKISGAWLEMLTFAAAQCSWSDHAEKFSQGGELLTHVWLLMEHFGMTDQFQISKGYIRAKLELK